MPVSIVKSLLCASILMLGATAANAQYKIPEADWDKLAASLSKENWKSAEQISLGYLGRFKPKQDTTTEAAIVRYMYLRSVAARLAAKEYTPAVALAKVKGFTGKQVITPSLNFKAAGMFNFIKVSDDKKALFLCAANEAATQIHSFETYYLQDSTMMEQVSELEGQNIRLMGTIKTIKTGGMAMPHFEIALKNTEVSISQ